MDHIWFCGYFTVYKKEIERYFDVLWVGEVRFKVMVKEVNGRSRFVVVVQLKGLLGIGLGMNSCVDFFACF